MIDRPSLAILIDCWELPNKSLPQNIISFLDNTDSIQTIVLASYNCNQHDHKHWFHKYLEIFSTNQTLRKIKDLSYVHIRFNNFYEYPTEKTEPLILNYLNTDKIQITMTWLWEIEYYLTLYPEIKNIYVLGLAWDSCVKIRPLGYESLKELLGINILTNTDCVLNMNGHNPDLSNNPEWEHVTETIWKYSYE